VCHGRCVSGLIADSVQVAAVVRARVISVRDYAVN
jgi:hypothetical protein